MDGERVGGRNDRRAEETFEGNRYFGILIMLMVLWVYEYVKTYQVVYFKYVKLIIFQIPQ